MGLLYRQGYFTQTVDSDGSQQAGYRDADPRDLPVEPVRDPVGNWLQVSVPVADREVLARLWVAQVGHVIPAQRPGHQPCTRQVSEQEQIGPCGIPGRVQFRP